MNRTSLSSLPSAMADEPRATNVSGQTISWPGLASAAGEIGVPLDDEAIARFARYRDMLIERNASVNLTAVREPSEVERKLFLDALAMIPIIDQSVAFNPSPRATPLRLIDVGSGAGFPGLALKIARPELDVTLLDATGKKVAFVNDVINDLKLDNVRAVHGRAEECGQDPRYRERFDLATARAVAPLPVLLELVMPFLEIGGQAFLPKGSRLDRELRAGRKAAARLGSRILSADHLATGETRLVVAEKQTLTAKAYPRRTGIPSRAPLGGGG